MMQTIKRDSTPDKHANFDHDRGSSIREGGERESLRERERELFIRNLPYGRSRAGQSAGQGKGGKEGGREGGRKRERQTERERLY
jgi:hypothetical protein